MGPKWTCATLASWEVETPTPLILGRPTWPLSANATLRPALTPLVADLNGYCTSNAPPWFTWCSIQIVRPQGTDTMGLHSHLRDGAPMALIVCVGSFTGGEFWVESGGLLNPSLREKKRHTRVCTGRAVEGWACTATPQAPVFNTGAWGVAVHACSTPGHYTLHCHGRASDGA